MLNIMSFTSFPTTRETIKDTLLAYPDRFRLCGQFASAIDALEIAPILKPDIILLSDTMIFLDLPTFIHGIAKKGLRISYILLHNRPESLVFAQTCNLIHATVQESTLTTTSLLALLDQISLEPDHPKEHTQHRNATLYSAQEVLPWVTQSRLFAQLLNASTLFSDYDSPLFACKSGYLLLAVPQSRPGETFSFFYDIKQTDIFISSAQLLLDAYGKGNLFIIQENKLGIWIDPSICEQSSSLKGLCSSLNDLFLNMFHQGLDYQRCDSPLTLDMLPQVYRQIDRLCRYRFFLQGPVILSSDWLQDHSVSISIDTINALIAELETSFETARHRDALLFVEDLFSCVRESLSFNTYAYVWNQLIFWYNIKVQQYHLPPDRFLPSYGHTSFDTLHDAMKAMQTLIRELGEATSMAVISTSSRYVQQAAAYLQAHITEDVTLTEVASHVHLSCAYLSQLFQRELGKSFSQLRIELRVELAKKVLRQGGKVYEAATQSGFNNEKYFSHAFKQITGLSPREYRVQCVMEEL